MNKALRTLIEEWHDNDQHEAIIHLLEKIPALERDDETIELLARAYNNVSSYEKALELLSSTQAKGKNRALWNFRMGYAHFYLDHIAEALYYFEQSRALDDIPDETTLYFIQLCHLQRPFAQRVAEFWTWFVDHSSSLDELFHESAGNEASAMEQLSEGLHLISDKMQMKIEGHHAFSFSMEDGLVQFLFNAYLVSRMPAQLQDNWQFFPVCQPKQRPIEADFSSLQIGVTYDEVAQGFVIAYQEDVYFHLGGGSISMPQLLRMLWGEGFVFNYILKIEPVQHVQTRMLSLSAAKDFIDATLIAHGQTIAYQPSYGFTCYERAPITGKDLRLDIVKGSTCLHDLEAAYLHDALTVFDHINCFGAMAVFIAFEHGMTLDNAETFCHDIALQLNTTILDPEGVGVLLGEAVGSSYGYIDLLLYDVALFIQKAKPFLGSYLRYTFTMYDFAKVHHEVTLSTAVTNYVPYDKNNAKAFRQQIEAWNDADKFSLCIRMLETIPEKDRDYALTLCLVRSYENFAIIGDTEELPSLLSREEALHKAIELLSSVKAEGEDDAYWNMRMAYAYQYLPAHEEIALVYAKRWAALDPDDVKAHEVIEECQAELEQRTTMDRTVGDGPTYLYSARERQVVVDHIAQYFGPFEYELCDQNFTDLHLEICIIPPTPQKNFFTLVSVGLGAYCMPVPEELQSEGLSRMELLIQLPDFWHVDDKDLEQDEWFWPIQLLKDMVCFPLDTASWLGWGHSVSFTVPLSDNSKFSAVLLLSPLHDKLHESQNVCQLPNSEKVNFYQIIPLYEEEVAYKNKYGVDAILNLFNANMVWVHPQRLNICQPIVLTNVRLKQVSMDSCNVPFSANLREHMVQFFGTPAFYLHDTIDEQLALDIAVITSSDLPDEVTLMTIGMSNYEVLSSDLLESPTCCQELLMQVPKVWLEKPSAHHLRAWNWALRLLLSVARMCIRQEIAVYWGKTMDIQTKTANRYANGQAVLFLCPDNFGVAAGSCTCSSHKSVEFLQVVPLHRSEYDWLQGREVEDLLSIANDQSWYVFNPKRPSLVPDDELK